MQLFRRQWLGEHVALSKSTTQFSDEFELRWLFDALGGGLEPDGLRDRDKVSNDFSGGLVGRDLAHE